MLTTREFKEKYSISLKGIQIRKQKLGLSGWNEKVIEALINDLTMNGKKKTVMSLTSEHKLNQKIKNLEEEVERKQNQFSYEKRELAEIFGLYQNRLAAPDAKSLKEQILLDQAKAKRVEELEKENSRLKNRGFWSRLLNK